MILAGGFLVVAVAAWWVLGWRFGLEVIGAYIACQVGANSPHTFLGSKKALERIGQGALAKAKHLALQGK